MELKDRERILRQLPSNPSLKRLYSEHERIEQKLLAFEHRGFLTVKEEQERKLLKLKKLQGVDAMMKFIEPEDVEPEHNGRESAVA